MAFPRGRIHDHELVPEDFFMRLPSSFAAVALVLSSGSVFAQPGTFGLGDLSGAELYARFCASCHGEGARGDGPVAPTLAALVPDLTRISERYGEFPADRLRQIIDGRSLVPAHGTRYMPVWGYEFWWEGGADRTAEADARAYIARLIEFLSTIQTHD
jgi:hypothetical protein